jgi:hypothetical protein
VIDPEAQHIQHGMCNQGIYMSKFNTYCYAKSFSNRTLKASAIILGDDGLFWVVTLRQMEMLLKAGYELAD